MTSTADENRIQDYLAGKLPENDERELERDLLAERHLSLLGPTPFPADPEERRQLLGRHVAELEALLSSPRENLAALSVDDLTERALAAEADLLDAYVLGRLESADRQWIARLGGSSERIRERLANAEALQKEPKQSSPSWQLQRAWMGIAAAALLTTTLWIGYQRFLPPSGPGVVQVVSLSQTATRSDAIELQEIGRHTDIIRFELPIPAYPRFTAFEILVKNSLDETIDRQSGLSRDRERGVLAWQSPVTAIAATQERTYTIEYRGLSAGNVPVRLGTVQVDLSQVRPD